MPLVTADCKEFLATQYPDLPPQGWQKEDKNKAPNGTSHWEFSNKLLSDNVFLLETNDTLQFDPSYAIPAAPNISAMSSKYLYSIVDSNIEGAFGIVFNLVSTWNKFNRLSEKDLRKPASLLPQNWEMIETEHNHWIVPGEGATSENDMMAKLEQLGFSTNTQFDQYVNGRSHSNSASYAAYKQKASNNSPMP